MKKIEDCKLSKAKNRYLIEFYNRFACQEQIAYILAYDELDAKNVFLKHYPKDKYYIEKDNIEVRDYYILYENWLE